MNPSIIQSYPHVNEYRRSSISSQENKRQLQVSPISDSYCSCCCSSFEEEEEQKSSSTVCTTPIDTTPVQENNDNEKTRGKKVHAIEELLQTERDYVQDLSHLVEICLKALSQQTWIPLHHKKIIIRNAHDILQFHKQFIITFDTASLWNNWTCIAQTFLDQMESFKLYTNYCDRHAEAWSLCSKYREKPEWTGFLKECAIMDSNSIPLTLSNDIYLHYRQQSTKRLQFEDYLIKPVQRICRYQLLIKEIIRYSSTQTSEYELWNSVLDEMQEIVSDIDRLKHERDMKECTDRFIERIESDWRITKSQLQKLDHVLIAGAIEVTYSALGSSVSKPRYLGCFVFSSYLIMVRPKKHTSYEPKHWFPLRLAEFEDLNDIQGQREYSFIVKCRKHTFIFTATCGQEKQLWASKLQKAISEAKAKPRDSKFSAEDFIVSSLSGIGCKKIAAHTNIVSSSNYNGSNNSNHHGDIRPSKSFSSENNSDDNNKKTRPVSSSLPPDIRLRRSMSTHIQFEDAIKTTISITPSPSPSPPPLPPLYCLSNKRYSADYTNIKRSKSQHNQHNSDIFIRNNSSSSNNNDSFTGIYGLVKRRPSSVDLLSTTTTSSNRISRMSLQFKNSQMNAMKITVDHKLRDVCTQDYLSLRAWYMREKDQIAYYQTATNNATTVPSVYEVNSSNATNYYNHNHNQHNHHHHTQNNNSNNSNSSDNSNNNSNSGSSRSRSSNSNSSSRKLSASFIRSSASSLSLMIPKRTADVKIRHCDITGSCSSSLDRLTEPSTTNYSCFDKKPTTTITTNPNSNTRDSASATINTITATNILFEATLTTKEESEDTKVQVVHPLQSLSSKQQEQLPKPPPIPPSFFISQVRQEKFLERKKSSGRIMANKVLQRMKSFRCNNNGSNKKTMYDDTNKIEIQENEKIERDNHDINNENVTAVPFIKVGNTGHNDEPSKVAHELDNCDRQIFKGEEEEKEAKERQQEPVKMGAFVYASTPVKLPKKRNIWKSKLRILHESFLKNDVNNNKPSTFV